MARGRRYEQGRASLRWATNLAARSDSALASITYFRQSFMLIAAVFPWFQYSGKAKQQAEIPSEQFLLLDYSTAVFHEDPGDPSSPRITMQGWMDRIESNDLAARYPERVSSLIAIATVADSRFLDRAKTTLAAQGTPEQNACAARLWSGSFENEDQLQEYFQLMGPMYSLTYDPQLSAKSWDRTIYSVDALNMAFAGFLRDYDIRDQLPNITAPTLVIGGRHDWICAPEFSEEIAAAIPNAELRIFENSGHLIRADEPEELISAIEGFLVDKS